MIRYAARRMEMGLLFYCCDVSFYPRALFLIGELVQSGRMNLNANIRFHWPSGAFRLFWTLDRRSRTTQTASAALNKHTPGLA